MIKPFLIKETTSTLETRHGEITFSVGRNYDTITTLVVHPGRAAVLRAVALAAPPCRLCLVRASHAPAPSLQEHSLCFGRSILPAKAPPWRALSSGGAQDEDDGVGIEKE